MGRLLGESAPSAVYQCVGSPTVLSTNWNVDAVANGGTEPSFSTGGASYCVISISDYHWNDGTGKTPGTIGLASEQGTLGPWNATGSAGSPTATYPDGVPNANWTVTPSSPSQPVVINGTYACADSDPASWSENAGSGGQGFCQVTVEDAQQTTTTTTTTTPTTTPTDTTPTGTTTTATTTTPSTPTVPAAPPCPVKLTGATVFEPTQAVWQDDPYHLAHPRAFKDYLKLGPGVGQATAELDMVLERQSLMFGPYQAPMKRNIVFKGTTSYTKPLPVSVLFELTQAGVTRPLFTAPPGLGPGQVQPATIDLTGPCGNAHPFTLTVTVKTGIGEGNVGPEGKPFKFSLVGAYALTAVAVAGGTEIPQIQGTVKGAVVKTFPPNLNFLPATLHAKAGAGVARGLVDAATKLSQAATEHFTDYLPIAGPPPVHVDPYMDLSTLPVRDAEFQQKAAKIGVPVKNIAPESGLAALVDDLGKATIVSGYSRTIVVASRADFANTPGFSIEDADEAIKVAKGLTASQKVIFMQVGANHYSLAHELGHSLGFLWSNDPANPSLPRDCGIDLHNASPEPHAAEGFQLFDGANLVRKYRVDQGSLMGRAGDPARIWTDQCSYKHFLDYLQGKLPDPSVTLVSGLVARHGGRYAGQLDPLRQFSGRLDVPAARGAWGLVIRDTAGRQLVRYPFIPVWATSETNFEHSIVSFQFAIEMPSGAASIALDGPGVELDRRRLTTPAAAAAVLGPFIPPVAPAAAAPRAGAES